MGVIPWEKNEISWGLVASEWRSVQDSYNRNARKDQHYTLETVTPSWDVYCTGKLAGTEPLRIAALHATAELGMPHTQKGYICLPVSMIDRTSESIIFHELVHIWQRRNTSFWNEILKIAWNVSPCSNFYPPHGMRANPDTYYAGFYGYKVGPSGRVAVPCMAFKNHTSSLDDVKLMILDRSHRPISEVEQWQLDRFFGRPGIHEMEHPFETAAYVIVAWHVQGLQVSLAAKRLIAAISPQTIEDQLGDVMFVTNDNP